MKKSLRAGIVASAAVTSLVLAGCGFNSGGGGGDDSDGATTITFLAPSYSDGTKALWEGIIKDFEAENDDVKVELQMESWENLDSVIKTQVQGDKAPDIMNGGPFAGFAAEDLLYTAEDVLSADTLADFQESFATASEVDGVQFGMPLIASARAMFYNKDLFEEAGISEPPATWDEFYDAAKAITDTGTPGYGMPLGNEEAQAESLIWFGGAGGGYGDENTITIDTPENLEGAEFMQKLIDDGLTQPDAGATQRTPMLDVFAQGKLGMAMALPQTVGQVEEKNADLNYGIAPIPTKAGTPFTLGVADHLMAFKNDGKKQDAITKFLDYFYSADVYTDWVSTEGFLPTTKSGGEQLAGEQDLKVFLDLLESAQFYPTTNPAWDATNGAIKSLVGQLAQGKDPAEVLQQIQQKADDAA